VIDEEEPSALRRLTKAGIPVAIAVVVLAGLVWLFWTMAHDRATVKHETPPIPVIALPPPPPPPPPPPKEQPPEPEKVQTETPEPAATPKAPAAPQNLTINGPPQAGGDAFGLGAGKGGGSLVGGGDGGAGGGGDGGFAEAAYTRYMTAFIQQAVQQDERVTRSVFSLDVQLWVDKAGKLTGATVVKSSGDAKLDKQVISVLDTMPRLEEPPPASFKNYFAHRITIRGRRS
jgi:TonB family protein